MMRLTSQRSLAVFTFFLALVLIGTGTFSPRMHAQSPPTLGGFVELATSTDVRALPSAAQLAELLPSRGRFTFPLPYGTTGIRLTNATDCSGADCVSPLGESTWTKISNSAGSTFLYVVLGLDFSNGGHGPTLFRYNKQTGETANLGPIFEASDDRVFGDTTGWYFSGTLPTTLYLNVDRQLQRYDVLSHSTSVVFDISSQFGEDKEVWDAHSSRNDRMHSFTLRNATNYEPLGCSVYREDTQEFSFYPAAAGYEGCQMDRSGHWLVIKQDENGDGGTDNRIVNLDLGTSTVLLDAQGAGGNIAMGSGLMLAADDHHALPNAIRAWLFDPFLAGGPLVYHSLAGQPQSLTSFSFANARSTALDQQFTCGSAVSRTNGPRANEIVCAQTDGSLNTLVVAPVMTDLDAPGGGSDDAAKAPNGALDPTGEYFLWTSNAMGARLDAFLVRVPWEAFVFQQADAEDPAVAITQPAQAGTVFNTVTLTASASDNVGIDNVQFALDGVMLGAELPSAPYSLLWDTTTVPDGVHVLTAIAQDAAGNTTVSAPVSLTVLNAPAGPQISNVTVSNLTQSSALISWTTNQMADTQVEYGSNINYGLTTLTNPQLTSQHHQLLTELGGGVTYHFRLNSRNAQSVVTTSGDFTFTTPAALAIINVGPSSVTNTAATISWATNLPSTSQVEYGLTTSYGDASDVDAALVTSHALPLTGLLAGTTYHYRVYSVTTNGSLAVTSDFTFTTPSGQGTGPAPGGIVELATDTVTRPFLTAGEIQAIMPTRGPFTLPAPYGTTAIRLTNSSDCTGGADCVRRPGGANWRNMSNSAGTNVMFIVLGLDMAHGGGGPTLFRYEKTTGETTNMGPLFAPSDDLALADTAGWYFSGTMPTALYVNVDRQLRRYDVLTHTSTVVLDITSQFGADKEIAQVHSSDDDRVHSFTLRYAANAAPIGCGVYREDTHQYTLYPPTGTFRECQVDGSGRWLLVSQGANGEQNRVIDLTFGSSTPIFNARASGDDVAMGYGAMVVRDTAEAVPNPIRAFGPLGMGPIVYQDPQTTPRSVTSLSFGNSRSALLTEQFACGSAVNRTPGPRANEIVCFKLDGSLSTLVVAPVMTDLDAAGGGNDAGKQPNGNLDPTGEYFLWTSNAMGDRLDAFLVRVPSQQLVTPPADTTPPTISITAPATGSTASGTVLLSANAADAVGVAGVQFQLDGVNLGSALTAPPFSLDWDTTAATDGAHTLMAVAYDAANNIAWAVPVNVTVLNTFAAPDISGVTTSSVTQASALVSWSTNQLADAQVKYGLTTTYGSTTALDSTLSASHLQLLSGLQAGTTYHFRVMSRNAQGIITTSSDQTFTTNIALAISGVDTTDVIDVSAVVFWNTNLASSTQIEYGLTTNYGDATAFDGTLSTQHGQTITGLVGGTTYHYRVYSVSATGVTAVSPDFTLRTWTHPVITDVAPTSVNRTTATIHWTTDMDANSQVEYGLTSNYGSTTTLDSTLDTSHSQQLTGLTQGTTYHYRVRSRNAAGLLSVSEDFTFTTSGGH